MDADSFHRLAKVLADSGEAETIEAAHATFAAYGVRIVLDESVAEDISAQVIALTAINAASRSFLGNVYIDAPGDTVVSAPGFVGLTLSEFSAWAGVKAVLREQAQAWPAIVITASIIASVCTDDRAIRPWADGWRYGIGLKPSSGTGGFFAPACVAAAGLAVSEAFSILRRDNPYSGRRAVTLSLWSPGRFGNGTEPPVAAVKVPGVWLVGLGHLGQAYAWTLGFMTPAANATLVLQDVDIITKSTLSTSMLSTGTEMGHKKTRVVASWLEARGYSTAIVERRFDDTQRVHPTEPRLALFGVDNAAARRVVEGAGFSTVVDAGLGSGFKDFRAMRVRTFPGPSSAAALWAAGDASPGAAQAPAYQALLASGADPCGVTTLATRAVGAPFVGCVAAGYAIAELVRRQLGGDACAVVDLNLRDPGALEALPNA